LSAAVRIASSGVDPLVAPATAEPSTHHRASAGVARAALRIAGWPARTALLGLIRAYRATLSGLLGGQCRFEPTCSAYAAQSIRARGALVGSGLAVWRVLRCNPFARGGADPAPGRHEYDGDIQENAA
jgi:uncharacterized protein